MKKINNREDENGLSSRNFAMRDVRFAGTVAAGLVAGVLGVGALTAPLLGWTEWPSSPGSSDTAGTVTLREHASATTIDRASKPSIGRGSSGVAPVVVPAAGVPGLGIGPSGTTVRLTLGRSGGSGTGTPTGTGTRNGSSSVRTVLRGGASNPSSGTPASGFGSTSKSFQSTDSDHDGMPDFYEQTYGLNPYNASDGVADTDGDGITNLNEFKLRSARPDLGDPRKADSNGDGIPDYQDAAAAGVVDTPPAVETPVTDQPADPLTPADPSTPAPGDTPPADSSSGGDNPTGTTPDPVQVEDPADDASGSPDDGGPAANPDPPATDPAPTTDPTTPADNPTPAPADPAPTTDPTPDPPAAPTPTADPAPAAAAPPAPAVPVETPAPAPVPAPPAAAAAPAPAPAAPAAPVAPAPAPVDEDTTPANARVPSGG
jgi:hypothetical protein